MTYKNINEIVVSVIDNMEPELRDYLLEIEEDDLIQCHHTVGRAIRNLYDLWDEENPYVLKAGKHPDAVSQEIITLVWKEVQNERHRED